MRSYGISKKIAEREFRTALRRGYAVGVERPSLQIRPISRLADVCTRWHLEKKFVERDGSPKPLTWNGRRGTLLGLVRLVVGADCSRDVVDELISRKLIRRASGDAWLPKAKVVAPSGFDNAQTLRTATMMERLLRTISHNSHLKYRGAVLLEVMAQDRKSVV